MNASEENAIEGVRVLWPTLGFFERLAWVNRLRRLYDDDFVRTVEALSGTAAGSNNP